MSSASVTPLTIATARNFAALGALIRVCKISDFSAKRDQIPSYASAAIGWELDSASSTSTLTTLSVPFAGLGTITFDVLVSNHDAYSFYIVGM